MDSKILNGLTQTLMKLDAEAKQLDNKLDDEYMRRAFAIKHILDRVKENFGLEAMASVVALTNEKLGHTLGPLHHTIAQDLIKADFKITKLHHTISYNKDEKQT
jgi:hypothetical protein